MPIYIRLSQLIFKKSIVELKFPGGLEKLKAMYKYDPAKHSIVSVGSYPLSYNAIRLKSNAG